MSAVPHATAGLFCTTAAGAAVSHATVGLFCVLAVADRRDGDGGAGIGRRAYIPEQYPDAVTPRDLRKMAVLAVIAIETFED